MNLYNAIEDALLEASRIQREELARIGLTLADLFPDEAASLRRFLGQQGPQPKKEKPL